MLFRHSPALIDRSTLRKNLLSLAIATGLCTSLPLAAEEPDLAEEPAGVTQGADIVAQEPAIAGEQVEVPVAPAPAKRNVILIIGDGMDDHQITIARNYLHGARGKLLLDQLPLRSAVQVLTVKEEPPHKPLYVADSANSASSLATGVVTSTGRISTSAGDDRDLPTITELAKAGGYATGVVTTASVTDATPAAFLSHVASRVCEDPTLMQPADDHPYWLDASVCMKDRVAEGGPGSIAYQIVNGTADIVLGGGYKYFRNNFEDGELSLFELAGQNGYQVLGSVDELENIPSNSKILGLFANDSLPTLWRGENGRKAEKPERNLLNRIHGLLGSVTMPAPMRCEPNPDFIATPTLFQLTNAALSHLAAQDGKGFFLMVESASIDKESHSRRPCGSIGELKQLDEAVAAALEFAAREPDTLVLVTADHGQAAQLIADESLYAGGGVEVYTPGHLARILTPEGQIMAVNYATNNFFYEDHSGANVPLFSNRVGAGRVPPMLTQPEIFNLMADFLQLPDAVSATPVATPNNLP